MERFAALATTAALAGALLASSSAAHATITYSLVPISDINAYYSPGAIVKFAVTVTTTNPALTTLVPDIAVAFDPNVLQTTGMSSATGTGYFPGTTTAFWTLTGPHTLGSTTLGSSVLSTYQTLVAHSKLLSGGTTLAIPAGTYTAATFSVPIFASTTATATTVLFPQASGYPGTPDTQDYVDATVGSVHTDQGTPAFGTASLTFKIVQPVTLSGTLGLEGVTNFSNISSGSQFGPFHFSFRTPGTTIEIKGYDVTPTATASSYGSFVLGGLTPGTYDVAVKGAKNLRVTLSGYNIPYAPLSQSLPLITLPAGDSNNDNLVDALDFNNLAIFYGAVYSTTVSNALTGYDPSADFNYDGVIDTLDFNLLIGDFGKAGAP